jgi:hypothetical protein
MLVERAIEISAAQADMVLWMRSVESRLNATAASTAATEPVPFVLRPGGAAAPGVYLTMAALAAAAAPVIAKGTPITVAIDDTLGAATVTGNVALSNYKLESGRTDGTQAVLDFAPGSSISKLPTEIYNVELGVTTLLAGQAAFTVTNDTVAISVRDTAMAGGPGRVISAVNSTVTINAYGSSNFVGGAGPALRSDATSSIDANLFDASRMDANSVGGVGTNAVSLQSSGARAAVTPNYALNVTSSGVFFVEKVVQLADLIALGAVLTGTVNVGSPLPALCDVLRAELSVGTALAAPGLISATGTVQEATEAPGALLGVNDLFVSDVTAVPGVNPVVSRGGEQLQITVTLQGANMSALTAGDIRLRLFCLLALDSAVTP